MALALVFAGLAYVAWSAAAGTGRWILLTAAPEPGEALSPAAGAVRGLFVGGSLGVNLAGLAWLVLSLALVVRSSHQRCSVSWAWMSAALQMLSASVGAMAAGVVCRTLIPAPPAPLESAWDVANNLSLPVVLAVGVTIWVTFLVWLLVERARMDRYGPTLRDGLRTNIYR